MSYDPRLVKCHKIKNDSTHKSLNAYSFQNESENLYGVVSGHCNFKESLLVIDNFQKWFVTNKQKRSVPNAFKKTFKQLNEKFCERNPNSEGLVIIVVYYNAPNIHIAWVGDNRACLINENHKSDGKLETIWTDLISTQHTTKNPQELERIEKSRSTLNNFIITQEPDKQPLIDGHFIHTRSIGDWMCDNIIISDPGYICHHLCFSRARKVILLSNIVDCDSKDLENMMSAAKTSKKFIKALIRKYTIMDQTSLVNKRDSLLPLAGLIIKFNHEKCTHGI
jgi:hypothetical protein